MDILINNAGVMLLGLVLMQDGDDWRRMIEVNQLGLLYCSHEALKIMAEQKSGHIVNVSSVAGRMAAMGSAVYNMTKWGVTGFSEALRQEGVHVNVRVTCVEPGFVDTELQGHNTNPMVVKAMEKSMEEIGEGSRRRRHRERDPLRGLPAGARVHQRGPGAPDEAAALSFR